MIAGFLVRECAIITAQELANQNSSTNSVLDFSQDVYIRYIVIDGIRYIKSLRNAFRPTVEPGEELLLNAQIARNIRNVYIGEDHLGIRHIQISSSGNKQFFEPCGISNISTRTDGLKVRDFFISKEQSTTSYAYIYWPIPAPTATIIDLAGLQRPQNAPSSLRISFFERNTSHTIGYSVATDGVSTATVHAHGQNTDLSFYKEIDFFFGHLMI
ncbi:hypothetical protein BDZ45DRAFT_758324 [Acephala macrosclerotiorum]|nr:hypothetical protein BDZ45DRAFT_758324 [Acephala macrosclerotiorum]